MSGARTRFVAGVVLPACGVIIAAVFALAGDPPNPIATHWDIGGHPNGSSPIAMFLAVSFVLIGVFAVLTFAASRRSPVERGGLTYPVAIATFLEWTFVSLTGVVVAANSGADTWPEAHSLPLPVALIVPAVAAIVAVLAARMVADFGDQPPADPSTLPTVGKTAGERLVWSGHVTTRWPIALGALFGVVGTVVAMNVGVIAGVGLVAAGGIITMFASVRVTADRRGLTVDYGPFGWPHTTIPIARVVRAEAIDVRPTEHGGWGYRGSLRLLGRASVVLRAGDGVLVELTDGKRFVVTVDDAERGAGTLNDLRPTPSPSPSR